MSALGGPAGPHRRGQLADERDREQDRRARQQDQRDHDQDRREQALDRRDAAADERERELDRRERLLELYRDAVAAGPSAAVERSHWLQADSRAHLQRRQDAVTRDSSALDRQDDQREREQHAARDEQAAIDREVAGDEQLPAG